MTAHDASKPAVEKPVGQIICFVFIAKDIKCFNGPFLVIEKDHLIQSL